MRNCTQVPEIVPKCRIVRIVFLHMYSKIHPRLYSGLLTLCRKLGQCKSCDVFRRCSLASPDFFLAGCGTAAADGFD